MDIIELISSAGFSGVLGGVFGWLTKREERANIALKLEHEVAMLKAKTDASVKLAEMELNKEEVLAKLETEKMDAEAFNESQKTSTTFSENIKAIIRPLILVVLLYQTYLIFSTLETFIGGLESIPVSDLTSLYKTMILSITSLTSLAVGWYFSARTSKQFDKILDKWKL